MNNLVNQNKNNLKESMAKETVVMRSLLDSIHDERQALLNNETERLKKLMIERDSIVESILQIRHSRITLVDSLSKELGVKNELFAVTDDYDSLSCEILFFRNQLVSLYKKVASETESNNYLIVNKLSLTKHLIQRLYPAPIISTYTGQGTLKRKKSITTIALINQEG